MKTGTQTKRGTTALASWLNI